MRLFKVLPLLAFCGLAHAEFKDGNKLLADMNSDAWHTRGVALGYVMGVVDTTYGVLHCAPENATSGQIRDMVQNYLNNKPVERTKPADVIIVNIVSAVWPCESKPKRGQSL